MKALIVVDMQNDFMDGGPLGVPGSLELVDTINGLMVDGNFDLVVATQDWHPEGHGSFAANHEGHEVGEVIELDGLDQIMWPTHCVQGTEGAEFVSDLRVGMFDRIFQKGTNPKVDSYSGFYDNGHREDTGLAEYLRANSITQVSVCGVAADYCVKYTVLDALKEGFDTTLFWDATEGVDLNEGDVHRALAQMVEEGARIQKARGTVL
jgi:nicotinamidase/pyrazinamidase